MDGILDYLQNELEFRLRNDVAPQFWKSFRRSPIKNDTQKEENSKNTVMNDEHNSDHFRENFINAVKELHLSVANLSVYVQRMDQLSTHLAKYQRSDQGTPIRRPVDFGAATYSELFLLLLKGSLHSQLPSPSEFRPPVQSFYSKAFHVYHVRQEKDVTSRHQNTSMHSSSTPTGGHGGFHNVGVVIQGGDDSSTCSNNRYIINIRTNVAYIPKIN